MRKMLKAPEGFNSTDLSRGRKFSRQLLLWNETENQREMPWKGETDPYRIWLSEIILQQTRVDQGLKYYHRFLENFPTVFDLAAAPEQQVFRLWEGLGYYSRCRNLRVAARQIVDDFGGKFPSDHEAILGLKGVGAYTAAAIASFAFNLPHAVLDGNVYRVLGRIHAIEEPSDTNAGKKYFSGMAEEMLDRDVAGVYNQAIMDFGATICKPVPKCHQCFFKKDCLAFRLEKQLLYPVRSKKLEKRERWMNYIVLRWQKKVAIRKRVSADIWQNLFEFLLLETPSAPKPSFISTYLTENFGQYEMMGKAEKHTQQLTHQTIHFQFMQVMVTAQAEPEAFQWVSVSQLKKYPFPKSLRAFIEADLL